MSKTKLSVQEMFHHGCVANNLGELVSLKSQISEEKTEEIVEKIIHIFREYELSFYQSEKVIEKVTEVTTSLSQLSPL